MSIELITVMMFGSLFFLLGLGLPVAFACGSVGVLFTAILQGPAAVNLVSTRIFGLMVQYLLAAIPLFIFMACVLERSGIIEELYELVYQWLGFLKGGVASATIIACTLLAAMVGVIGASEVTMGVIALPQMLKRKYNKFIACGSILAGGTLGILIPPSVMLIVYGLVDNSSIGQLYAGAILPGLLLASLFTAYVSVRCYLNPKLGPPVPPEDRLPLADRVRLLLRIIPPMILIFLVLGTIFTGIAAPTEAAGVGAAGAIVMTAVQRKLTWKGLVQAAEATLKSSAMVMWTIFGANIFVGLYVMVGGGRFVSQVLLGSGLSHWGIIIVMQFILIFLGCFIDWVGIIMLCVPIFGPIIRQLGFDPIWFGVLFAVNLQVSFLSPPFGYALFYLKGVAPPEISTTDIWKSSAPFIGLQILGVIAVMVFPEIILWLPRLVYRG
ncbi:MAG: TRAP transporter large permease subunit [Deltaproteobacteria bacterium]|nr:TRAP transporter large permease subunit [Deltaproteobacteria bacterium]MBW2150649.1 TRAP transporter large permease subunit [Deltaproteobacteria bacterium]